LLPGFYHVDLLLFRNATFTKPLLFKGKESDPMFAKVAKQRAKQLRLERLQSTRGRGATRGRGYHPYARFGSGYNYHANGSAPAALGVAPSSPSVARAPLDKSQLRCNYCKEMGHFVKECPRLAGPK